MVKLTSDSSTPSNKDADVRPGIVESSVRALALDFGVLLVKTLFSCWEEIEPVNIS